MGEDLVGIAETARMLGVSRQRVHQIAKTNPEFPKPVAELAAGRIWRRADVNDWIQAHPDRQRSGPRGRTRVR